MATSQTADILFPQTRQTACGAGRPAVRGVQKAVCRRTACCARFKLPPVRNKVNLSSKLGVQNCMALYVISLLRLHCRTVTSWNGVWRPWRRVNLAGSFSCRLRAVFSRDCYRASGRWPWGWNVRTACSGHLRAWRHAQKLCCKSGLPLASHDFRSFIVRAGGTHVSEIRDDSSGDI